MVDRIAKEDQSLPEFPLLSDPGHKVIDLYGLLNPSGRGLPHPATYIIDKKGIVRWRFVEVDYKVRPTNEQIIEALRTVRE
jgi:peroxiredoxin